jgi:PUB domain
MEVDSADELPSQTVSDNASGPSTVIMDVDVPVSAVSESAASPTAATKTNLKDVVLNSCGMLSPSQFEQREKATEATMMECGASSAIPIEKIESASMMTKEADKKVAEIVKRPLSKSCDDCVDLLLSQNFDRASSPCILTIVAYVQNILSDPSNSKFRSINIANKTFQGKISKVAAALELLQSIGFTEVPTSNSLCITASSSSLESSLKSLVVAMDRLQIPLEDRPKPKPPKSSFTESQQNTFRESWDPYKSSFVSTAPQVSMQI